MYNAEVSEVFSIFSIVAQNIYKKQLTRLKICYGKQPVFKINHQKPIFCRKFLKNGFQTGLVFPLKCSHFL